MNGEWRGSPPPDAPPEEPRMGPGDPEEASDGDLAGQMAELERVANALQTSAERFRLLEEQSLDMIFRYRTAPPRGFEYVSPSATRLSGYTPAEHHADPDLGSKLVHPEDRHLLESVARGQIPLEAPLALRWIRKDGAIVWTETRRVPVRDSAGCLVAIEGIVRDITDRKLGEEKLRESGEKYRQLVESISDLIFTLDLEGRVLFVNPRIETVAGYRMDEIVGHLFDEFIHQEDLPQFEADLARAVAGEFEPSDLRFLAKSGNSIWVRSSSFPIVRGGEVRGLRFVATNITDRKLAVTLP